MRWFRGELPPRFTAFGCAWRLSKTASHLIRIMLMRTAPPLIAANFLVYRFGEAKSEDRLGQPK
jgi:hypothetical protein